MRQPLGSLGRQVPPVRPGVLVPLDLPVRARLVLPDPSGQRGQQGQRGQHGPTGPTGSGGLGTSIVRTNTVAPTAAANGMIVPSPAACESNERLLSGGVLVEAERPNDLAHLSVIRSAPAAPNGWLVQVLATTAINAPFSVTASALCLVQE